MVEVAKNGWLSTVKMLLDEGNATVEDEDEVKCVYVCACLHPCAPLPFLVYLVMGQCIHQSLVVGAGQLLSNHIVVETD